VAEKIVPLPERVTSHSCVLQDRTLQNGQETNERKSTYQSVKHLAETEELELGCNESKLNL
jgi:hypothetical protein